MFTADETTRAQPPSWPVAMRDALRRGADRMARARLARHTLRALTHLDARTLRDIGLDASEVRLAALEAAGRIDATRWHVWHHHAARG
ncbi:MAG: DUF1127 domain-containing protein [Piscinibacter sp.]|nr:DUF1127 domain-containing protein [Piscinibacter sp.]